MPFNFFLGIMYFSLLIRTWPRPEVSYHATLYLMYLSSLKCCKHVGVFKVKPFSKDKITPHRNFAL